MASTWGASWGSSWGDSWGVIAGGGGSTVVTLAGLSVGELGKRDLAKLNFHLEDAGGGTFTVTVQGSVSQDDRTSLTKVDYEIS
jgi:hypothetical protein